MLFGSLPVIAKPVLSVMPAVMLVGLRVGIAALILLAVQCWRGRIWLRDRRDYVRLAVLSLFGVTLNQLLFIGGLSRTKASNTSLLVITIPIFTLAISVLIGTEKLTVPKFIGLTLAAAGVVFLIDPRNASLSSQTTMGDLMIIANSLAFGIYVATSKDVVTRNGAFRSMMWVFIFASLICVPLGLWSYSTINATSIEPNFWWLVLYISILATAAPYLLNAFAISRVDPSVVTVFIYLQPLIGFLLAVVFLNEVIDLRFVGAAAFIFTGVFLTTRRTSTKPIVEA
jgi:drug/metabolite transporter (DMT)-like permease